MEDQTISEPKLPSEVKASRGKPGRPCAKCGSNHTEREFVLRPSPSVVMVILCGWIFLLIRGAFSMRTDKCLDCGADTRYKSLGSWVALAALIFVIFCVVCTVIIES